MRQHKPAPMLAVESLRVYATRRMLWWVMVLAVALFIPTSAMTLFAPSRPPAAPAGPLPVPPMDWTTDGSASAPLILRAVLGGLPSPGPNQKRAGECRPERSEVEINGGCWVQTTHPKPCPDSVQWEHDGKCWLPVAYAKPTPTSGGGMPVNVAEDGQ